MSHGALANLISWQLCNSTLQAGTRTLQFTSLNFDVSFQEIFSTWCAGGTLVLISEEERRDPVDLLRFLTNEDIQTLHLPFVALQQLGETVEHTGIVPHSLCQVITAGEQLQISRSLVQLFTRLKGCSLHNHYGPSESHVVTAYELTGPPETWPMLPPIGRPIANTEIYLLDKNLGLVPVGVEGELYIGGVALGRGYNGRPELTAERYIPHPFSAEAGARLYRSGDWGRYLADGEIEYLGRRDEQVKVRGYRIEPGEIEAVLCAGGKVSQAVVVGQADGSGSLGLVAYVVAVAGQRVSEGELREQLRQKLPEYMVPGRYQVLEELPLTASGKVGRGRLPAVRMAVRVEAGGRRSWRTEVEEIVAGMWEEVLGISEVGAGENFFELGGHSLLATRLMARVRERLKVEVALRRLFEGPTVEELAQAVEEELRSGGGVNAAEPIKAVSREGDLALSYAQRRLWFLDQLEPGRASYNLASAISLKGNLQVAALEQCLNCVTERHETPSHGGTTRARPDSSGTTRSYPYPTAALSCQECSWPPRARLIRCPPARA